MNQTQKAGVAIALVALVAVIFLHNPTEGYVWEFETQFKLLSDVPECLNPRYNELGRKLANTPANMMPKDWTEYHDLQDACASAAAPSPPVTMPYDLWHSKGALVPRLGYVGTFLWAVFALISAAGLWLWIFKTSHGKSDEAT